MFEKFLKITAKGYTIEFADETCSAVGLGTTITVRRLGKSAFRTINLDHAKDFGLDKDVVIMTTINMLIDELDFEND